MIKSARVRKPFQVVACDNTIFLSVTLFRPSFPWGGDLGRAGPYISMRAPDTTGVASNGSHYRDSRYIRVAPPFAPILDPLLKSARVRKPFQVVACDDTIFLNCHAHFSKFFKKTIKNSEKHALLMQECWNTQTHIRHKCGLNTVQMGSGTSLTFSSVAQLLPSHSLLYSSQKYTGLIVIKGYGLKNSYGPVHVFTKAILILRSTRGKRLNNTIHMHGD